jgi:hypothetical protein
LPWHEEPGSLYPHLCVALLDHGLSSDAIGSLQLQQGQLQVFKSGCFESSSQPDQFNLQEQQLQEESTQEQDGETDVMNGSEHQQCRPHARCCVQSSIDVSCPVIRARAAVQTARAIAENVEELLEGDEGQHMEATSTTLSVHHSGQEQREQLNTHQPNPQQPQIWDNSSSPLPQSVVKEQTTTAATHAAGPAKRELPSDNGKPVEQPVGSADGSALEQVPFHKASWSPGDQSTDMRCVKSEQSMQG